MEYICAHCKKVSYIKYRPLLDNIYLGASLPVAALALFLYRLDLFGSKAIMITYSSLILVWGLVNLYNSSKFAKVCPKCEHTGTLVKIDSPIAQELIKENNLTVATESTDQTKAPST